MIELLLGYDRGGNPYHLELAKAPHVLAAGMTGSGKSVAINAMIADLITRYERSEVRLLLLDPKRVELSQWKGVPHAIVDPLYDPEDMLYGLEWAVQLMEQRYRDLEAAGFRDIAQMGGAWDRVVIVIDELAQVLLDPSIRRAANTALLRLTGMSRAVGIHILAATQRPSVDVISGLLKANIPTRLAFATVTAADSRVILDQNGAEHLSEPGSMLARVPTDRKLLRLRGGIADMTSIRGLAF